MSELSAQDVTRLLHAALELEPGERAAFLEGACGGDAALLRKVRSLLAAHERAGETALAPDAAARPAADSHDEPTFVRTPATDPGGREGGALVGVVLGGKYRLDALLGRGGMGAVYRATQLHLERAVAVKVMRDEALADAAAVARFRREALTVARLKHPHIVAVHDFGVEPGAGSYLVMEYLEGRSLREELRERGTLPPEEAVALIRQVLGAAHEAHAAGVVHRDFKPENILLEATARGTRAKVLDFGIAKLREDGDSQLSTLTGTGEVLGTPLYMAPEQLRGDASDARADVYSLGCVLYEALTGRPPYVAKTVAALAYKHLDETPAPPSRTAPAVPEDLDRVVLRALAKEPADRYQTAEAFSRALEGWGGRATGETARLGPDTSAAVDRPTAGRRAATTPNNLAREATQFVGRAQQLEEVKRALETTRLVTLTGPGGAGKTRLALRAAEELLETFAGGVYVVDLAPVSDPDLVLPAIAATLGVARDATTPVAELLARAVGDERLLLVLDNFEQVLGAAPRVAELLASARGLTLLATSRAPLRVRAERELPVPPLSPPEAAALFVERARAVDPRFGLTDESARAVAEICRRLDGLPLALELAAARVKLLTPQAMLERLDQRLKLLTGGARDLPERHRTMRAAVAWSYELLEPEEQVLFHRLSVFAGGFAVDAAEAVCAAAGGLEVDVLEALASLVDKSLVRRQQDARLSMLETIREYALERLRASGEAAELERRHAEYYLALGERLEPGLAGALGAGTAERLDREHENVRSALTWLLANDPDACLRLGVAVRNFWLVRGHYAEGRRWLEAALERGDPAPSRARAVAFRAAGTLALRQGDLRAARASHERSWEIAKATGDELSAAASCFNLGVVAHSQGDVPAARAYLEESLALGEKVGSAQWVAYSLSVLGDIARAGADRAAARPLYERAAAILRSAGNAGGLSAVLCNLGVVLVEEGDAEAAEGHFREALAIARELGIRVGVAAALDGLASVAARRGAWARAARLAGAAGGLRDAIGAALESHDAAFHERTLAEVRGQIGGAALEAAVAEGRELSLEEAASLAEGPDDEAPDAG